MNDRNWHKVSSSQSTTKQAFSIGGIYHVTVRFSLEPDRHFLGAFADVGDLLKRLPVLPVWVSASENFEGALSTHYSHSVLFSVILVTAGR